MKRNILILVLALITSISFAQNPPTPVIASQTCGTVILQVPAPPSNVLYYWQGTSCGAATTSSVATYEVTASGTYFIRYYDNSSASWGNCSSIAVDVPVPPAVPSITVNGTTLSYTPPSPAQPNVIYVWQGTSCGNSMIDTSSTYAATSVGTYYLRAIDTIGGCWSDTCSAITIVGQNELAINANVFPNPSNGLFSIELEQVENNVEVKVYDLFGRVIFRKMFVQFQNEQIDLSNYAKGMYILNLQNKSFTMSKNIIIE